MKTNYKVLLIYVFTLFCFLEIAFSTVYSNNADYTMEIDSIKKVTYNSEDSITFSIKITSNIKNPQKIQISNTDVVGWEIKGSEEIFILEGFKSKTILLNIKSNNELNYKTDVESSSTIKISKKDNYIGTFEFPVEIKGENENISLKLEIESKRSDNKKNFIVEFPTSAISSSRPFNFAIKSENIDEEICDIRLEIDKNIANYNEKFTNRNNYKIFEYNIPSTIKPGIYPIRIVLRLKEMDSGMVLEWNYEKFIEIDKYEKIDYNVFLEKTIFQKTTTIELENKGNVISNFTYPINKTFGDFLLTSDNEYFRQDNKIFFHKSLNPAEKTTITYSYNYFAIYILIIALISILVYIYIKKNSNPLYIQTKIYNISKVKHEGVKSLKIKIDFENFKAEKLDEIKVIFRMPRYLNIEEDSFLLTKPNHVLKGEAQYKLVWNFKKMELNETRILGFMLINSKGVLGDIKIPDLEIEIKHNGKIKRFFKGFPIIRG